ncbi:MAG: chromate transporter [Chitinispirillales bacterium]|jgi:chromate transporter|nr:chromate transporter [Chitinispirillales bacterium]
MTLLNLLISFLIIGAGAFGGGYSTITMIEHEIVTVHGWITSAELSDLIAIAQMTPGPIGVNAATYTGYHVAGFGGAAVATFGFTLPSIIFCFTLIRLFSRFSSLPWIAVLKKSVQPAVVGLILAAVLTYGRASITDLYAVILAAATFTALSIPNKKIHPVLLILCGGIAGIFIYGF